jgi:hypothetical protein
VSKETCDLLSTLLLCASILGTMLMIDNVNDRLTKLEQDAARTTPAATERQEPR